MVVVLECCVLRLVLFIEINGVYRAWSFQLQSIGIKI